MNQTRAPLAERVSSGIEGFDIFTGGGFPKNHVYLIEGDPGVGKTTFALQFLLAGAAHGEKVLLISLSETHEELLEIARSHQLDIDPISCFDLAPSADDQEQYSIVQSSEIEFTDTVKRILAEVDRLKPTRVVLDSLSEMRLLAQNPLKYRRQVLALKRHFTSRNCTVMLLDDRSSEMKAFSLQSMVHGVVELQKYSPIYGKARRKLQVVKLRGVNFQADFHDFTITTGGIRVYPRLIAADHHSAYQSDRVSAGIQDFDGLLGGGLDRGTTTLIMGPAGCGKSSLSVLYAVTAAERGENAAIFTFDEGLESFLKRSRALNMDLEPHVQSGRIHLQQIDPAEMSPGEFMWNVKEVVEGQKARVVAIDSLTGYLDAMPESQFLTIQMHEMLSYLNQQGVLSILTMAQHGYLGVNTQSPSDISYLADTIILLQYFETRSELKKAMFVVKKRTGAHQSTIREYGLGPNRIVIGRELTEFHGILTGTPVCNGEPKGSTRDGSPR